MILNALAERLRHRSRDDFKGRYVAAWVPDLRRTRSEARQIEWETQVLRRAKPQICPRTGVRPFRAKPPADVRSVVSAHPGPSSQAVSCGPAIRTGICAAHGGLFALPKGYLRDC